MQRVIGAGQLLGTAEVPPGAFGIVMRRHLVFAVAQMQYRLAAGRQSFVVQFGVP